MAAAPPPPPSASPRKREKKRDVNLVAGGLSPDLIATGGDESVNVCVRVRPFNRRELEIHQQKNPDEWIRSVIEMPEGVQGSVRLLDRDAQTGEYKELEMFKFTKSFWSIPEDQQPSKYLPITQEDVYDTLGRVVMINALMGFNCCVFAYGQTGSGKTHTMMGNITIENGEFVGEPGVIPRLCQDIFRATEKKKAEMEEEDPRLKVDFDIKLSALEIYNEQVRDLFWKSSGVQGRTKNTILKIRVHPTDGAFVDQLTVLNPKTWEQCLKLIATGVSERTVAATLMNDESSRSHSVFQINIVQTESQGPPLDDVSRRFEKPVVTTKVSRINLVDLAGSERNKKSGVQGQQLREAAGINQSLSTLKKVIDALVNNGTEKNPKKHVMVPYRESCLTQLLSHSLGGNSKTTMVACVSPHYDNTEETLNTLRYAARAKGIVNHVKVNEDNAQKQAMLLKQQMEELKKKLAEGPQVYTEKEIEDLRDQIAIGEREMAERQRRAKLMELEAQRVAAQLKTQKDARYAATYYNSFKRCWLERQRTMSEQKLHVIEAQLNRVVSERDQLGNSIAQRERQNTEAKYSVEELKRRGELWMLKSARNEAMARQLARDIAKAKSKTEETLMARFGSVWVRNRSERQQRQTLEQQKEAMRKDHEQYMNSIQREAKKQFDTLTTTYSDREASQRERLEQMDRSAAHGRAQLDKAEQQHHSLTLSLERSSAEHSRREQERDAAWHKRYDEMRALYEEKLLEMETKHSKERQKAHERLAASRRKILSQHASRVEDLRVKLGQLDSDGERRLRDVEAEASDQTQEIIDQTVNDTDKTIGELQAQFDVDVAVLREKIAGKKRMLLARRAELESLCRFALEVDDTGRRVEAALCKTPTVGPGDFVTYRRQLERFVHAYKMAKFDFHRVSNTVKKSIPSLE
jgi:hypothetical protein